MSEAYRPFLEYLVLQIFVAIVGMNIVRENEIGFRDILKSWIYGQMLLFAVFQVLAVPMILMRWEFNTLFWSYTGIDLALFGFGCWRLKKDVKIRVGMPKLSSLTLILLMIVVLLIVWQAGHYFFGMHLDEDDARWLAEANDALEYGDMMTRDFNTGEFIGRFLEHRDATSPWPMMYAVLSKVLACRVTIIAHTIYPALEIFIVYAVYYLIGAELLKDQCSRVVFILLSTLCLLFYGGTVYTQGTFTLVRLWQGKASVAGVIIPLLLYLFIGMNTNYDKRDWAKVCIVGMAGCLMSGMGISISLLMIMMFGLYNLITYKNWKSIPFFAISILPSLTYTVTYFCIRR